MPRRASRRTQELVPPVYDWRTTDEEEIQRRRLRSETQRFRITNAQPRTPIFSNFHIRSPSGLTYSVEIRSVRDAQYACNCVDFRVNGLGTCKHVEAVLRHLEARHRRGFAAARKAGSDRVDLVPEIAAGTLRLVGNPGRLPKSIRRRFDGKGYLLAHDGDVAAVVAEIRLLSARHPGSVRVSQEVDSWLEARQRIEERRMLRHEYEQRVQRGEWPIQETRVPLYPYQREGMLHLAFAERALLADEMGLGKTIQAIAACALLHRLGKAQRVLVVTPASLKTEWEEQIQRFTDLPLLLVFGPRHARMQAYENAPFFTIVNYEQMLTDALEVNERLRPDIVILDEAQRIKNWNTKTSQAIKRLRSRYAFVLTGTPIENRIDELHSLMDFLEPSVLGPLFRFNREYYEFDERGRPLGFRNLRQLHDRIRPFMLRRRKADVETELPDRTDKHLFVGLSPVQQAAYDDYGAVVARLVRAAKRRHLSQQQQQKLLRHLAMMRMVCDTNFILDPDDRVCPKLAELEKVLESCRENDAKVLVFSEWERMLMLVRELCEKLRLGYAWHTGSVPQRRRRAEINAFKTDPACRVFLSTETGSTGLNLQNASVVVNCDLPWNPARLEQRIARAWRKHQSQPVTVIHLVSENTIEHRMIETLAGKQALADGVLDLKGDLDQIKPRGDRQAFLARLQQLLVPAGSHSTDPGKVQTTDLPADRTMGFAQKALGQINGSLVQCEERFPREGVHSVLYVVVDRDAALHRERLLPLHDAFFGPAVSDPLAPVTLEVVDRATHEALERLAEAGLISITTRGCRPLLPSDQGDARPLSEEERLRVSDLRARSDRGLRMARLLGSGGFAAEARGSLLEAGAHLATALAVVQRLPEPQGLEDALRAPLANVWDGALPVLRSFVADPTSPWEPVADTLEKVAQRIGTSSMSPTVIPSILSTLEAQR